MNQSQLTKANIENLTNLWKAMGATAHDIDGTVVRQSSSWPHRLWFEFGEHFNPADIDSLLTALTPLRQPTIIPAWTMPTPEFIQVLKNHRFHAGFEQRCMVLDLTTFHSLQAKQSPELVFSTIKTNEEADCWTYIASESFGYMIDPAVTQHILRHPDITLILAYQNAISIGSALIYTSNNIVGIHMVGVIPSHRRKGFAKRIMSHILSIASQSQVNYATLQASVMGEPLYRQLGFQSQFTMTSFVNVNVN